ncbi:phosphoribosylanthranilate isomerase [Candidatus Vidania fulgoroideorum]
MKLKKKIKFCGFFDFKDIQKSLKLNINLIGIILYCKSKRFFNIKKYKKISKNKKLKLIIVFVNNNINYIYKIRKQLIVFLYQIHGNENLFIFNQISKNLKFDFIKSYYITNNIYENNEIFNFLNKLNLRKIVIEKLSYFYGGSGKINNYFFILKNKKVVIAGGISKDFIPVCKSLYYYDISSSIEKGSYKSFSIMKIIKDRINNVLQLSR